MNPVGQIAWFNASEIFLTFPSSEFVPAAHDVRSGSPPG